MQANPLRSQLFISPLRLAQPPVIRSLKDLEDLISTLFGNILELRAANASLLEFFTERQREQGGVISTIGDVYLTAAAEFRNLYPDYIGRLPRAEERLREELASNSNFRFFVDVSDTQKAPFQGLQRLTFPLVAASRADQ